MVFEISNEELATRIKAGEKKLTNQLWQQIEAFVWFRARSFYNLCDMHGLVRVELEDLVQQSYIAMVEAVHYFEPEKGGFLTMLDYCLKTAFANVAGFRLARQRNDGIFHSYSGDAPKYEDSDETIFDLTPAGDDVVVDAEKAVIDRLYNQQLHNAIAEAFKTITPEQESILRDMYYKALPVTEIAARLHQTTQSVYDKHNKALEKLYRERYENGLNEYLDTHTNFYAGTGLSTFKSTWTSSVESAVMRRDYLARRWHKQHPPITSLREFVEKHRELMDLEHSLKAKTDYRAEMSKMLQRGRIIDSLDRDIAKLQEQIHSIKIRLGVVRDGMIQTLSCIEDDVARISIRLFYVKGLSWDEVADFVKCSADEVRERVDVALDAGT